MEYQKGFTPFGILREVNKSMDLKVEFCTKDLMKIIPLSESALSKHLANLVEMKVLKRIEKTNPQKNNCRVVCYSCNIERLIEIALEDELG